jgi:anaerobic selenocysteine-containing dehydrogenase
MDIERRDFLKAMGGVAAAMTAGTGMASANIEGSLEVDVGLGFVEKADIINNEQILDVLEYIASASDRDVEITCPGTSN